VGLSGTAKFDGMCSAAIEKQQHHVPSAQAEIL